MTEADRALCDFAIKLTLAPGEVGSAEVSQLENHGLTHEEIHIAVQVIGYFNYINRIAGGLGVEPESWMKIDQDEWKETKAGF